jgi:8-oxo-dGTP pyrophosphatase MutT (NUDIX family)
MVTNVPIRHAATVILSREGRSGPEVLMGQRGAGAAFMPNKFVFPGGAVDPADALAPLAAPLGPICQTRLDLAPRLGPVAPQALAATALRELHEETGLRVARAGPDALPLPDASALRFVFRAITPPARPRRFDARFFLADAARVLGDPEDFSAAEDELSHLQWIPLSQARSFDLPFITEVVLAEVARLIHTQGPPDSVPFFDNSGPVPTFLRLR